MSKRHFVWQPLTVGVFFVAACSAVGDGMHERGDGARPSEDSNDAQVFDESLSPEDRAVAIQRRYEERLAAQKFIEITGEVVDVAGKPLQGVTVSAGGKSVQTDQRGGFALSELPFDVHVVSFDHPDYVFTQQVVAARYENQPRVKASMLPRLAARTFNADQNVAIEQGPLVLTFEPGDLMFADTGVAVHGEVQIVATTIEPGKRGHIEAAPARLEGLDASGQMTGLDSFGMFEVEITQNGRHVQVRPGETVGARMQVPQLAGMSAGGTIPMWHHDRKLGIWVEEAGLHAEVEEKDGVLVASTEVPHFSAWNLDGPKQSLCVMMRMPRAMNFRAVSTDAAGSYDGYWMITGECQNNGRCVTNAPSGWTLQNDVTFKFQVQMSTPSGSQWCDINVQMARNTYSVLNGDALETYSKSLNASAPDSSFCGTYNAIAGDITASGAFASWRSGIFAVPLAASDPDNDGDLIEHLVCPGSPSTVAPDPGFGRLSSNALSISYFDDYDRDGVNDTSELCPSSSNDMACDASCYVAPGAGSTDYDFDSDEVDDFCDSQWTVYNPSQYNGL